MNKIFGLLSFATILLMASCSSDSDLMTNTGDDNTVKALPSTSVELKAMSDNITMQTLSTKTTAAAVATNTEETHFYIRIDNRIPGIVSTYPSSEYYPQTAGGGCVKTLKNKGLIDSDANYKRKDDAVSKYIFSTNGTATQKAIVEEPTLADILSANSTPITDINPAEVKVIWYVVKKQNDGWHVDGVLTTPDVKDVTDIPGIGDDINNDYNDYTNDSTVTGNVEVDIHQQEHKDWDEIKTSIHIRADIDTVAVTIPIANVNQAEADDFAIRTYGAYYTLENYSYPLNVVVEHNDTCIKIKVSDIPDGLIAALKAAGGDGLTIEVHSYAKDLTKESIYEAVKASTVEVGKNLPEELLVHRTSAYYDE